MFTDDFKRLLVGLVMGDTLMTLKFTTKAWKRMVDAFIDEGVRSGQLMIHGGNDTYWKEAQAQHERCKLVTRVISLLNVMKVGKNACWHAVNLAVVDIPDGVESIDGAAFCACDSLTTVSFPTTLTLFGWPAFYKCSSLDNVDLLHTNLQELDYSAFGSCSELKSMTTPDLLQTLGKAIFRGCSKLVPSDINVRDNDAVVAHLRSKQLAQN
ncbi:hypothetical protein TrLO_g10384 [Triparma laevis f. longispina]|uniref:Uncharacterized protein n=1 Tax=Triparma laevis f. longispina TaxID=1714387 RepID=A0A9W7DSI7_9STRA|nr:hypothetical protein TrLO_g10384 [Triparma laevis f. longispina]